MTEAWPSTKGLSVFNALKLGGAMTPPQIADYLREHWDPETSDQYVIDGIGFIAMKSWVRQSASGELALTHPNAKAGRSEEGDHDLVLVSGAK